MRFGLYIFDLDGTLIDTRRDITAAANEMLEAFGLEPKGVDEVTGYVGDGVARLVERCLGSSGVDHGEAAAVFRDAYARRMFDTTSPYAGVPELLAGLASVRKAVLTNKPSSHSGKILEHLGLSASFDLIVGGDSLDTRKPDPQGALHILDTLGEKPESSVLIGDNRNDILTAKRAGITSVYVTYGFTDISSVREYEPDHVVNEPIEILELSAPGERVG